MKNDDYFIDNNKRIKWIDSAKGISIILMIIGHCLLVDNFFRNFIFSFHIPLFFILSGYNLREINSFREFGDSLLKDFKKLFVPSLFIIIVCNIVKFSNFGLLYILKNIFISILWSNGVGTVLFGSFVPISGAFWFLACLFVSKNIVRLIDYCVIKKFRIFVYIFIILFGFIIGNYCWLPFSFDICLASVLFLKIGIIYRKNEKLFQKYSKILIIVFCLIWLICLLNGFYIEFAVRYYPGGIVCVIEAVFGSFTIIYLCKFFEKINFRFFSYIGKYSREILIIHCIEDILFNYSYIIKLIGINLFIILRVTIVLVIVTVIGNLFRIINKSN